MNVPVLNSIALECGSQPPGPRAPGPSLAARTAFAWSLALAGVCALPSQAAAESRALIVSIGEAYPDPDDKIGSSKRDAQLALEMAKLLGLAPATQVRLVTEEGATRGAIEKGFEWVVAGPGAGEVAFIYYSGHGTQVDDVNGDEDDGCDEAIVPVDFEDARVFTDDDIGRYVAKLAPQAKGVMIIDSCFSGTITRSYRSKQSGSWFAAGTNEKGARLRISSKSACAVPVNLGRSRDYQIFSGSDVPGLVVLTATAPNEVAWGTTKEGGKGSLFTQALYDQLTTRSSDMSFRDLRESAALSIEREAKAEKHTPQLEGDPSLFDKGFRLTGSAAPPPPSPPDRPQTAAEVFDLLVRRSGFGVNMHSSSSSTVTADSGVDAVHRIGEELFIEVQSTREGYLTILEIRADGKIGQMFPNRYVSSAGGKVSAGQIVRVHELRDPATGETTEIRAGTPKGRFQVLALVTPEPFKLATQKSAGAVFETLSDLALGDLRSLAKIGPVPTPGSGAGAGGGAGDGAAAAPRFGATRLRTEVVE